jgi:uncharacterized protein YeaO (DUF488 family)
MPVRIVRLGSARAKGEGLRIGTVRRPPRGVPRDQWAARDFYDVWFPNLAPSEALLKVGAAAKDARAWTGFRRKFLAELKSPAARRELELLAALSHHASFAIGCYCEDETRCHRSILRDLLEELGADITPE